MMMIIDDEVGGGGARPDAGARFEVVKMRKNSR